MAFQTIRFIHTWYAIFEILIFYAIYCNKKVMIIDLNNALTNKTNV